MRRTFREWVTKKPWSYIFAVFVMFCLVLILVFLILLQRFSKPNDNLKKLVEDIVPKQATDIRYTSYSAFQSTRSMLRFTLHSSGLSDFIENFCPGMELTEGGYNFLYNEKNIDWWKPEDAKVYFAGRCVRNNIAIYQLLVDKTNPDAFLIYISM